MATFTGGSAKSVTNGSKVLSVSIGANTTVTNTNGDLTSLTSYSITGVDAASIFDQNNKNIQGSGNFTRTNVTIQNGGYPATLSSTSSKNITGATNASPIVLAIASHGYADGTVLVIAGVGGNTNANGVYYAKATGQDSGHIALYSDSTLGDPVPGNSNYTTGGTSVNLILEAFSESNGLQTTVWTSGNSTTFDNDNVTLDLCAPEIFNINGTCTFNGFDNTSFNANMKRYPTNIPDATWGQVTPELSRNPWLIQGTSTQASKSFSGNYWGCGRVVLNNVTGWDFDGNTSYGDRAGFRMSACTDIDWHDSYHHMNDRYAEFPNNLYGSQVTLGNTSSSTNVRIHDNILRTAEWIFNGIDCELDHNFIFDMYSHDWITSTLANLDCHHNIFGPRYDGVFSLLDGGCIQTTAALNVKYYKNTFHGGAGFDHPAMRSYSGVTLNTIRDNLFYDFRPATGAIVTGAYDETLPLTGDERVGVMSNNAYHNPNAGGGVINNALKLTGGGSATVGDVTTDPGIAPPTSFAYDEADIRSGDVTVASILSAIRNAYVPTNTDYQNTDSAGTGSPGSQDFGTGIGFDVSPTSVAAGTSGTLTFAGNGTTWLSSPPAFFVIGVALSALNVTSDTAATMHYDASGASAGDKTIFDSNSALTATLTVTAVATLTQSSAHRGDTISGTYAGFTPTSLTIGATSGITISASAGAWSATVGATQSISNTQTVTLTDGSSSPDAGTIDITAHAPTMPRAQVNPSDNTQILASLDRTGCTADGGGSSGTGGFTLAGTSETASTWSISGSTVTIQCSGPILAGVTLGYARASTTDDIKSLGEYLANFSGVAVSIPSNGFGFGFGFGMWGRRTRPRATAGRRR